MGQLLLALLVLAAVVYGAINFYGASDTPERPRSIDPQAIPNQYKQDLEEALRAGADRHREVDRQIN